VVADVFQASTRWQFWHAPERALSEIKIPCFLIGGLLDGYRDSIPRMFEQVKAP